MSAAEYLKKFVEPAGEPENPYTHTQFGYSVFLGKKKISDHKSRLVPHQRRVFSCF